MSALAAIQAAMVQIPGTVIQGPLTNSTGGTSVGDSEAGSKGSAEAAVADKPVTTGDRVAAGFLTFGVLVSVVGGTGVMLFTE